MPVREQLEEAEGRRKGMRRVGEGEVERLQEKQEERKEVEERGRGEKKEKSGRSRSSSGATNFGATDKRYREVKTCPKLL